MCNGFGRYRCTFLGIVVRDLTEKRVFLETQSIFLVEGCMAEEWFRALDFNSVAQETNPSLTTRQT